MGIFLVYFSLKNLTREDFHQIKSAISEANMLWIWISLAFGFTSHYLRALRWKIALQPLGFHIKTSNALTAVFSGYLVNLVIPRAGEISRAAALQTSEKVPTDQALGSIVAERVIDLLFLGLIIISTVYLQNESLITLVQEKLNIPINGILIAFVLSLVLGLFVVFKSKAKIALKVRGIIQGIWVGLSSLWKLKQRVLYLIYSLLIWLLYLLMFYAATLAIPETTDLSLEAILTGFIAGTFSIAATNGGIGSYPLAIEKSLMIFGVPSLAGLSFGWLMWTAQTLMIIILGGLSFLFLRQKN